MNELQTAEAVARTWMPLTKRQLNILGFVNPLPSDMNCPNLFITRCKIPNCMMLHSCPDCDMFVKPAHFCDHGKEDNSQSFWVYQSFRKN